MLARIIAELDEPDGYPPIADQEQAQEGLGDVRHLAPCFTFQHTKGPEGRNASCEGSQNPRSRSVTTCRDPIASAVAAVSQTSPVRAAEGPACIGPAFYYPGMSRRPGDRVVVATATTGGGRLDSGSR
jgi:hypothetical protein